MGLGSNQGDRSENLLTALSLLCTADFVKLTRVSGIYETAPVGYTEQPFFYNAAAALDVNCSARDLLKLFLETETGMGRVRTVRWGPRLIDLDLLLYGSRIIKEQGLCVPHPELMHRRFVLQPLMDLCPHTIVPGTGRTVQQGYHELQDGEQVVRVQASPSLKSIEQRSRRG